ncbi:MAG: M1 family metallopeptidase [Planctomycetota bacterium]
MHDDVLGLRRHRGDFTTPGAESHYPPDLSLEPRHLDITLGLDIDKRHAAGTTVLTVGANREDATAITLHAVDFEDVAVEDPDGREVDWRYDGREISVTWAEAFRLGEERKLAIAYSVTEPITGLQFSVPDEAYPDRARWAATDHETERARYWLPCVDLPAVRTTLAFHLAAPEHMTILANGLLTAEDANGDGTKTAHWELDYPCPSYLVCFALGEFVRADDEAVDGREIAYFGATDRTTAEDLSRSFGDTPEIMRWMQERFGVEFPFAKYFQFALPGIGGAMENISLVSWDDRLVTDEIWAKDLGEIVQVVNVHEMGHSYFGDAVVIRDFAHAWLKESWATYTEALWYEDKYGDDAYRYEMFTNARNYMTEADERYVRPIVTRVFDSSWDMYDYHLYPGGAWRIHMLRRMLGEEAFWGATTDYLETYSGRTVETDDFRKLLESHSGRSLGRFFDQWIHGRGYPKLKVTFAFDKDKSEGTFTIEQSQVPEKPEKDSPETFAFDLDVAWETEDGEWIRRTVSVEKRRHTFLAAMDAAPKQIRLDPDGSLLHRPDFNPGNGMLRRALTDGPDAIGRILAAEELAKTGKKKNLEAVAEAFAEESFYGVRAEMAKAVAKSKVAAAVPILAGFLEAEEEPRVLTTIAREAGAFRDPRIAAALRARLDGDLTYYSRSAALLSLGMQRGEEDLDRLRESAADDGYRGIVRSGALAGLAATRTEAAFEVLAGSCDYGDQPHDARPAAPGALAGLSGHVDRRLKTRAVEKLIDLLRDPDDRVRRTAIGGLASLKAGEATGAVEAALATFAEQDRPRLRRSLKTLRGGDADAGAAAKLRKEFDDLQERHRKLEARVDELEAKE